MYAVQPTRSGVARCSLCTVLNLCRMCQYWLHMVLWLHIGILMLLIAADLLSTAVLFSPLSVDRSY